MKKPITSLFAIAAAIFVVGLAANVFAADVPVPDKGDTSWMIVATVLVSLMTIPGLALFYGGLVRTKNMLSLLMQVFTVFSLCMVLWVVYGYSLAFCKPPRDLKPLNARFETTLNVFLLIPWRGKYTAVCCST